MSGVLKILNKAKETAKAEPEVEAAAEAAAPAKKTVVKKAATPVADADASTETETVTAAKTATTKAKPAAKAKTADLILDTAHSIENLTENKALAEVKAALEAEGLNDFKVGGLLAKIQTESWFGEHPNFRSFVTAELGIEYRKAMYLVSTYNELVQAEIPFEKVKHLGWTKLKDIARVLTADNVDDIVAAIKDMNSLQVRAYITEMNANGGTAPSEVSSETSTLKSKTFKLFEGQRESVDLAIEKAKATANTDSDAHALELICVDYVNATKKKPTKAKPAADADPADTDLKVVFSAMREQAPDDLEASLSMILEVVSDVFPEVNISAEMAGEDAEETADA